MPTEFVIEVIEVRGMKPTTSEDTIRFYFEGRKVANADAVKMEFIKEKNMYMIWFEKESAIEAVMSKSLRVDGQTLNAKRYVPPPPPKPVPKYDNKVFITNIGPTTTKDELESFLKEESKCFLKEIIFGEAKGTALATFERPQDIEMLQRACMRRQLTGRHLSIHTVPITDCIVVTGYKDDTSLDTMEYYFENKRRSGVEGVRKVKFVEDEGKCLVYFTDPDSALEVCNRAHKVEGQILKVQVYYECLRQAATGNAGPYGNIRVYWREDEANDYPTIKAQVAVEKFQNPEPVKIQSIDYRKIEFLLNLPTEKVSLENLLLSNHARVKWPKISKMNDTIEIFSTLAKYMKNCISLSKTWVTTVREQTKTFFDMICVNELSISQEIWDNVIKNLPSGEEHVVVRVNKRFRKVSIIGHKIPANEITMLIEDKIKNFEEDLNNRKYKSFQKIKVKECHLSLLDNSQFAVDMQLQYNDLTVTFDLEHSHVVFTGTTIHINKVIVKMFEVLKGIECVIIGKFSDQFIQYLSTPEVSNFVRKQFNEGNVSGVWNFHEGNIISMYSMSDEEARVAVSIFLKSISHQQLHASEVKSVALESKLWLEELNYIKHHYQKALIEMFIVNEVSDTKIFIYSISSEVVLSVHHKIRFFFSSYTLPNVLSYHEENGELEKLKMYPTSKEWRTNTDQSIYIYVGDITCLDVDIIVNAANKDLELKGGLARVIVEKGGETIWRECYDFIRRYGTLQEGDVMYTSAGDLPCKGLVHAVSPVWKGGYHNEFGNLYNCVKGSFEIADQHNCATIALPALSTGISGSPVKHSTKTIVKSIYDYLKENGYDTLIQKVYLCDINKDTVDYFESALNRYFL